MLEETAAVKIVLTHSGLQRIDRPGDHIVFLPEYPPGHVEGFLVPVNVVVIEITVFVQVHCQLKGLPAPLLVHHDLPALKFGLIPISNAADFPDRPIGREPPEIGQNTAPWRR